LKNNIKYSLQNKLKKREEEGTLRSLSSFEGFIDFFSNDYLGIAKVEFNQTYFGGSTGSRLISGTNELVLKTEDYLANHFKSESALIFNSGYDANLGLFSSILLRDDYILYDQLIHASIRDGIRLGLAKSNSFKHNDCKDLEEKLKKSPSGTYVVIESLYSMDGDFSQTNEIVEICDKYNAYLIIDEAHSGGIIDKLGRGEVVSKNLENKVFARIITFGKAFGCHGAVVLGSHQLITYLVNFSRSFIYTTALPKESIERILKSVELVSKLEEKRVKLYENIHFFRSKIKVSNLTSDAYSPIQIIRISNIEKLQSLVNVLQNEKIAIKPIFAPTVPKGEEGIRICIHSFNSKQEIENLTKILNYYL